MKSSNKKSSKLKPNELEKKIQFQDHSKWEYIQTRKKTIEFKRPVQTSINHRLSLILPLSNVDNKGQYLSGGPILDLLLFYIPENKYKGMVIISPSVNEYRMNFLVNSVFVFRSFLIFEITG